MGVWMVLCIVFIVLFGVALLAVAFLGSFVWNHKKGNGLIGDVDEDDDVDKVQLQGHQYLASKSQIFAAGDNVMANCNLFLFIFPVFGMFVYFFFALFIPLFFVAYIYFRIA